MSCNSDINKTSECVACLACGMERPQENLPWLKELIEKSAFVGNRHFSINDDDFGDFQQNMKLNVVIYSTIPF
jgi:hypothetical protein